jgi:hypothetical protein
MNRIILDRDLKSWEVYATSGDFGAPAPAKMGFRCTSDPAARPRLAEFAGDKSDAERAVLTWPEEQLLGVFEKALEAP